MQFGGARIQSLVYPLLTYYLLSPFFCLLYPNFFHIPPPISFFLPHSVNWSIEDLMLEYAGQIEVHMNKLVSLIEQHHWRTNPSVLAGMRVALFRKGTNPLPTIVTG
jgi:hypothetical protein